MFYDQYNIKLSSKCLKFKMFQFNLTCKQGRIQGGRGDIRPPEISRQKMFLIW